MRARVLGPFELESDLGPVRLPTGHVRVLLELLLLRPGEAVTAGSIVARLWPDAAPTDSAVARRLHTTVSRLRAFLSENTATEDDDALAVVSVDGGYLLRATPRTLDLVAFDGLLDAARRDGLDAADAGQLVEVALAYWRGEPFTGFAITPDVLAERARLQEARAAFLERREQLHGGRSLDDELRAVKLRRPRVDAASFVRRPRLQAQLPAVGEATLITLEAPVGYGKSVLLSQWAQTQAGPVAWLNLDSSERDPARFWRSFTAAVGLAAPARFTGVDPALPVGSAGYLHALADALAAAAPSLAIVLDDVQVLDDAEPLAQLGEVLRRLPQHVTVVAGSREPLAPLVDSVGDARRVVVVPAPQLRFDIAEIEQLCASAAATTPGAIKLAPEDLRERTGGWPVAIASIVRAGSAELPDPGGAELGGELIDRIVAELPAPVRAFLLDTALLERLSRDLCDAVTGRDDAGEMLTWLRRHDLFIVESVGEPSWYRYHELVRDGLRRLAELQGGRHLHERHRRAARWYLAHGLNEDALHHAVLATDRSIIAPTSGEVLLVGALRGETAACRHWMRRLDPDVVAADPRSHALAMVTAVLWVDTEERGRWIRSRIQHYGGDDDLVLAYARAVEAADQGRATESVELTQRVLDGAQAFSAVVGEDLIRALAGTALSNLVLARLMQGTLRPDDPLLPNTVALLRPEVPIMAAWIHLYWALVAVVDGDDELARALVAEFADGTEGVMLAGARSPSSIIDGVLAAAEPTDPARLRRMADGLMPAIETYTRVGAETRAALTRYAAAYVYRHAGERERAAEERARADVALRTFADAPFVERFRDHLDERDAALARTGGPAPGVQVEPLTDRELAVLRELATSRSTAEIAEVLHISVHTVRSHTRAIYRKLAVSSRHQAVLRAREIGY